MKKERKSFVKGALILIIFGLISKVIGAIYRLPLTSIVTAEGMGLYQLVFPVYTLMLTISSGGLPASISKLISESLAKRNYRQANKILKIAFLILITFSLICSIIVLLLSGTFARIQGNENAKICFIGIAPAIIFVGLIAGFRGYFQGLENMFPSAISGFIEQLIKLLAGLFLAQRLLPKGIAYSVFGAMIGISLSEFIAFIFLLIVFIIHRKRHKFDYARQEKILSSKDAFKKVLSTSFFITLGGLVMPLGMMVDSVIIVNVLKNSGYSASAATVLFGLQSGTVGSIVNMPVVVSLALATAILPRVSAKRASGDVQTMKQEASKAVLLAIIIALPASFGCLGLAEPIIKLLYRRSLSANQIIIAVKILEVASISIFYLALVQVTAGILQGVGLMWVPVISLSVGMVIKILLDLILVRVFSVGILGAEMASGACYLFALIINLAVLKHKGVLVFDFKIIFLLFISALAYFGKYVFKLILKTNINYFLSFFTSVFIVIIVYFVLLILLYRKELLKRKS